VCREKGGGVHRCFGAIGPRQTSRGCSVYRRSTERKVGKLHEDKVGKIKKNAILRALFQKQKRARQSRASTLHRETEYKVIGTNKMVKKREANRQAWSEGWKQRTKNP